MKTRFFTTVLFCTIGLGYGTAQVQTEKRDKMYNIDSGTCYGTETCPFQMDERGAKKLHGTYSFSGGGERSSSIAELKFKYNISAACQSGKLHGPINVTSQSSGKYYDYIRGWIPVSGSNKLVGTFSEGVPTGKFNIVLNNGSWKLSATLKNNHFEGPLSVYGIYNDRLIELNGQFDSNGKMIGTWQVRDEHSMQFVNGVQINIGTPDVQEMARKYAAGSVSETELRQKGYFLGEDSIPTQVVVDYILNPEFNIRNMGVSFNCTPYYVNVHYTYVFKLNMLTEEGLQVLESAIQTTHNPYFRYRGINRQNIDINCSTDYCWDEKYQAYYLECDGEFTREYGTIQESDYKIYITEQQKIRLQNAIEQQYPNVAHPFTDMMSANSARVVYNLFVSDAPDLVRQFYALSADARKSYIDYFSSLSTMVTEQYFTDLHLSIVADGAYLLARMKINNGFRGLYVNGLPIVDSLLVTMRSIDEEVTIYDNECATLQNAQETIPFRQILQKAFITLNSEKKNMSEDMRLLAAIEKQMLLVDTIMMNDVVLRERLEGKELKDYEKMVTVLEKTKITSHESYEDFVNALIMLKKEQEGLQELLEHRNVAYVEQKRVADNNAEILTSSAVFPDLVKGYKATVNTFSALQFSMTTIAEADAATEELRRVQEQQQQMLHYLALREQVNEYNTRIMEMLLPNSKCTKAYQKLYKLLPLDEQSLPNTLELLRALSETIPSQDLKAVESALKKAKTADEMKSAFGLCK